MIQVPFFRVALDEDEIASVVEVLRSGWLTTGKNTTAFELAFAEFLSGKVEAVAVNSATAAMHLALEALGIGPGDEVICPTLTFTATAEVIRYLGADPVLVDCDPKTLLIQPEAIETAITPRTKAVMPVHFAGLACDMPAIAQIARRNGLKVVDDAAHALPTYRDGNMIGTIGADATAFSFYANKTMTTGEGGMLVSSNTDLIERARQMRLHGIDRDAFNRFTEVKANWQYDIVAPGYKYNLTDMAGALGLGQLARAEGFRKIRRRLVEVYDKAFVDLPLILPEHGANDEDHSWHLYIVRLAEDAHINRDRFIAALGEAGVGTSVHYTPLHMMSYWRNYYGYQDTDFPNALRAFNTMVSLPLFMDMRQDEQAHVIASVRQILGA